MKKMKLSQALKLLRKFQKSRAANEKYDVKQAIRIRKKAKKIGDKSFKYYNKRNKVFEKGLASLGVESILPLDTKGYGSLIIPDALLASLWNLLRKAENDERTRTFPVSELKKLQEAIIQWLNKNSKKALPVLVKAFASDHATLMKLAKKNLKANAYKELVILDEKERKLRSKERTYWDIGVGHDVARRGTAIISKLNFVQKGKGSLSFLDNAPKYVIQSIDSVAQSGKEPSEKAQQWLKKNQGLSKKDIKKLLEKRRMTMTLLCAAPHKGAPHKLLKALVSKVDEPETILDSDYSYLADVDGTRWLSGAASYIRLSSSKGLAKVQTLKSETERVEKACALHTQKGTVRAKPKHWFVIDEPTNGYSYITCLCETDNGMDRIAFFDADNINSLFAFGTEVSSIELVFPPHIADSSAVLIGLDSKKRVSAVIGAKPMAFVVKP
jgi:hypothetical protein